MKARIYSTPRKKKSGAILVMIIGIIFLLGFIVTEYLSLITDEIRRKNDTTGNYFLKIDTYNTLELTLAYLNSIQEVDKGLFGPKQGWNKLPTNVVRDSEASDIEETTVTIIDESGKIGLRKPNKDLLITLFKKLKFDDGIAQDLSDALINWISTKEKADPFDSFIDYYNDQEPPYFAANIALIDYNELRFIKDFREHFFDEHGNPNELFWQFKSATSLFNDNGININTAPPIVIETLSTLVDIPKAEFTSKLWGPDEEPGTKDDLILRDPKELLTLINKKYHPLIQVNPSYLKIVINTHFGERSHTLSVLLHLPKAEKDAEKENSEKNIKKPETKNDTQKTKESENTGMKLLLIQENQPLD